MGNEIKEAIERMRVNRGSGERIKALSEEGRKMAEEQVPELHIVITESSGKVVFDKTSKTVCAIAEDPSKEGCALFLNGNADNIIDTMITHIADEARENPMVLLKLMAMVRNNIMGGSEDESNG